MRTQVLIAWGMLLAATVGCETTSFFARNSKSPTHIDSTQTALTAIRESKDPGVRLAAFEYLSEPKHAGGEKERDEITNILGLALKAEQNAQARIVILGSLARLGSPKRTEAIAQAAEDKDAGVRVAVCRHLGQTNDPEAAKKLDNLLISDSNLDVRLAAASALGNIPCHQAALSLLSGIDDRDVAMRYRCRESLKKITGKDHTDNVAEWRQEIQTTNFEEVAGQRRHSGLFR